MVRNNLEKEQIIYINFEDERLNLESENLQLIFDSYYELFPNQEKEIYLFLDEIQEIPEWEKFVRRVYDHITKKIFLTGSSSKMLSSEIASSLRGRTIEFKMNPLNFREYSHFREIDVEDIYSSKNSAILKNAFKDYLNEGGYPDLINRDSIIRTKLLDSYFNVMIFKDLIERFEVKNHHVLKEFIKSLSESIGSEFSINKIYNDFKSQGYRISKNSLYLYLDYCKSIFLYSTLEKFCYSSRKRRQANKKIYIMDTGLLNSITYRFSNDYGKLLENLIFNLLKQSEKEVFYLGNGFECGFIVRNKNKLELIQVAYDISDEKTRKREIKSLLKASESYNDAELKIITFENEEIINTENKAISVIPAWKWCLSKD